MSERPSNPGQGPGGILLAIGAVFLAVTCCAGPALLAGGGLVLLGGVLGNPVVLAIAVLVLAGAVLYTLRRRARARSGTHGLSGAADREAGREAALRVWTTAAPRPRPTPDNPGNKPTARR